MNRGGSCSDGLPLTKLVSLSFMKGNLVQFRWYKLSLRSAQCVAFCVFPRVFAPLRQDEIYKISRGAILHFTFPGVERAQRAGMNRRGPSPMASPR